MHPGHGGATIQAHGQPPVRVMHICKYFPPEPGGIESFAGDLLPALTRRGIDAFAVAHHRFGGRFERQTTGAADVWLAPAYGRLLYAPVSPLFPVYVNWLLSRLRPHIVHVHMPNTSVFPLLALPRLRRCRLVLHWHADVVASPVNRQLAAAYRLYRPAESHLLGRADAVIVTSPAYLESSLPLAPWKHKCHVIPIGIEYRRMNLPDDKHRAWAEQVWGRDVSFRVLSIGRLTYYKGHDVLVEAAGQTPGAVFVIAGDGEGRQQLEQRIRQRDLGSVVKWIGAVSEDQKKALLATCDCFCLPSTERTEAFGVTLLEAMCYQKPVIGTDIRGSGVGWVVQPHENGLLAHTSHVASLAAAVAWLRQHPQRAEKMGQSGYLRLQRRFSIDSVSRSIEDLYMKLAESS